MLDRRITRKASTIGKQARVVRATVKLMTVGLRGCLGGLFTVTFSLRSIRSNHPRRPNDVFPFNPSYSLTMWPLTISISYLLKDKNVFLTSSYTIHSPDDISPIYWNKFRYYAKFLDKSKKSFSFTLISLQSFSFEKHCEIVFYNYI